VTRPHVFRTAVRHAEIELEKFSALAAENPRYIGQWKSAKIALLALNLVAQFSAEDMILSRLYTEVE